MQRKRGVSSGIEQVEICWGKIFPLQRLQIDKSLKLARENPSLSWHFSANASLNHHSLITLHPFELWVLGWLLGECSLGSRSWWLKGSSGMCSYQPDFNAVLSELELSFCTIVVWWFKHSCSLCEMLTLQLYLLLSICSCWKSSQFFQSAFLPTDFLEI